jgi:hypothetical protein
LDIVWATCPQVVKYTFGPPATIAIFIFDCGTTLPDAALVLLPLDALPLDALPLDALPPPLDELLQAATPRTAIAASGARYLQPRLPAVLVLLR